MENSLKQKEHNIKLNNNEIFKWFTKTKQKAHGKIRSNLTQLKMYKNHLKIGKCQLNIIKLIPVVLFSTLKSSWDISPDKMDSDFQHTSTSSLKPPSCFTNWSKRTAHLIKADHPNGGHPMCDGNADHPTHRDDLMNKWMGQTYILGK